MTTSTDDWKNKITLCTCEAWTPSRWGSSSWSSSNGVFLIGGAATENTTEIVDNHGGSKEGFPLTQKKW